MNEKKPFSILKVIAYAILIVGVSICLMVAMLPTLLSTEWGKSQLLNIVNKQIPGSITAKEINLSWFGKQAITDVTLKDPTGSPILNFQELRTNSSLITLLLNGLKGNAHLTSLNASLIEIQPGITNLHQALKKDVANTPKTQNPLAIELTNVNGDFHFARSTSEPTILQLNGNTTQNGLEGQFSIDVSCAGIDFQKCLEQGKSAANCKDATIKLDVNFTNFPVALLDQLVASKNPELARITLLALGKTLDLSIQKTVVNSELEFNIKAKTPTLKADLSGAVASGLFSLNTPGTITFDLTPEFIETLAKRIPAIQSLGLTKNSQGHLNISKLTMPICLNDLEKGVFANEQIFVDAELTIPAFSLSNQTLGLLETRDGIIKLKGNPLLEANCQASLGLITSDKNSLVTHILGPSSQLMIDTTIKRDSNKNWDLSAIQGTLTGDLATAHITGHTINGKQFVMTEPLLIHATLTPSLLKLLGLKDNKKIQLNQPSHVVLTVNSSKSPLDFTDLSKIHLSGKLVSDQLSFNQNLVEGASSVVLQNLNIPWEVNGPSNKIQVVIEGETQLGEVNTPGSLKGELNITNWLNNSKVDFKTAAINAKLNLEKFPIALLEAVSGRNDLVAFLGNTMDISLNTNVKADNQWKGLFNLALKGDQFHGNSSLHIDNVITLAQPIVFDITVTPKRFNVLRTMLNPKTSTLNLQEPANIHLTINSLNIPWQETPLPISKIGLNAKLSIEQIKVADPIKKQKMAFEQIVAQIDTEALGKKMNFHIEAQEKSQATPNEFIIKGFVENAFTDLGKVNTKDLSLNLEARTRHLPASLFCTVACLNENVSNKIEALLGDFIDSDLKLQLYQMSGPFQVTIQGNNGTVFVDAKITNGVLTLNKPLDVAINVTPQLGKSILEEVLPILTGVIKAEKPVKITVDPAGFSLPVLPFTLAKVKLGKATIELGKMTFNNEGELGTIFDLLKPSAHEALTVWFTPIYLNMQDGILKIKRMDMLMLNLYPLALWGKVDLIKEYIDMRIGLTGTALSHTMNLTDLDPQYMMQLPLKGKMGEASIDKAKAAARISALIAQNQGGSRGLLVGTFLEIAGGGLSDEQVPEPTTNPLPWGTIKPSPAQKKPNEQKVDSAQDTKKKKKKKNVEDHIQEGASTIIKNLFH